MMATPVGLPQWTEANDLGSRTEANGPIVTAEVSAEAPAPIPCDCNACEKARLTAEVERLRAALEFYGDETYYHATSAYDQSDIDADYGRRARAALKEPRT